jgi:hypothetical protein
MLVAFYSLENCETTIVFRCIKDNCPASYNSKDSLYTHNSRKHMVKKFNCPEYTDDKRCPFSSTTLLDIQKHRNRFHGKNIPNNRCYWIFFFGSRLSYVVKPDEAVSLTDNTLVIQKKIQRIQVNASCDKTINRSRIAKIWCW